MAKQRNSLGLLVFPTTDNETISWDEYKKRTGIDLDEFLKIEDLGTPDSPLYQISVRETCRKIIAISCETLVGTYSSVIPPVMIPNQIIVTTSESPSPSMAKLIFQCTDRDSNVGYYLNIAGDKTLSGGEI